MSAKASSGSSSYLAKQRLVQLSRQSLQLPVCRQEKKETNSDRS